MDLKLTFDIKEGIASEVVTQLSEKIDIESLMDEIFKTYIEVKDKNYKNLSQEEKQKYMLVRAFRSNIKMTIDFITYRDINLELFDIKELEGLK